MTKKKFVSILLVICMLMTLMPTFALAEDGAQPPVTTTEEQTPEPEQTPAEPVVPEETPATTPESPAEPTDTEQQEKDTEKLSEEEPTEMKALEVVDSIADADNGKSFYNVLFANGQDVTVEPANEGEGLLVTIGETQYTFATRSTSQRNGASDGLTIFAGSNGSKTEVTAADNSSSAITIKDGAQVGAIFAGGYGNSTTAEVAIVIEAGAEAGAIYGGGLTANKDKTSQASTGKSTITVDGKAGIIYAGGRAAVGPGINEVITFKPANGTTTAKNWVDESTVTINGTVNSYLGGSYSYGGVEKLTCNVNGTLASGSAAEGKHSAVCGTNGYCGEATMNVALGATITGDLYVSMRGYVGDITLNNAGTISHVSLNPDGKVVSSFGNVTVTNTGTITNCNLDCGCSKEAVAGSSISPYPAKITVDGDVTVSTAYWESNTEQSYTAQEGQTIVLLNGAKMAEGEAPITNVVVAKVGDDYYTSLSEALAKAGTVTVLSDCTLAGDAAVTIGENKDITLDLNGHTVDSQISINMRSAGKLTIQDSSEAGDGVLNFSKGRVAVYGDLTYENYAGKTPIYSTLTLKGGTIATAASNNNATIGLFGKGATFNMDGGSVINNFKNSETDGNFAVAGSGLRRATAQGENKPAEDDGGIILNIGGGTIESVQDCAIYLPGDHETNISGDAAIKGWCGIEIDSGKLNITGEPTITSTYTGDGTRKYKASGDGNYNFGSAIAIVSKNQSDTSYYGHMDIDISGGTFSGPSYYAIDEYNLRHVQNAETPNIAYIDALAISGGNFQGAEGGILSDTQKDFITGGTFSSDPSAYVAAGYKVTRDGDQYTVAEMGATEAAVVPAEPEVKSELKDLTKEEAKVVTDAVAETKVEGLADVASQTVAQSNQVTVEDGTAALGDAGITVENSTVSIVIQPYIEITAKAYDDTNKTLTLDITPKYNTLATIANPNTDDIVVAGEGVDDANAVIIAGASGKELTINEPVTVTVTVPAGFLGADTSTLFIKHAAKSGTYYYKPEVNATTNTLTFTNAHGFSEFQVQNDDRTATVSFVKNDGTTITPAPVYTPANVGESFPTDSKSGSYTFKGWNFTGVTGGPYETLTDDLLTKLAAFTASPITATPSFTKNSSGSSGGSSGGSGGSGSVSYTITATAGVGGQIAPANKVSVTSGGSKTFTITANTGYVIDDVLVDGKSVGAVSTYTFDKVTKAHTIEARFAQTTGLPFTDISATDWFYAPVKYVYNQKLMVGTAADQFGPYAPATRGMIVTMLWRMEGEPAVQNGVIFNDVADSDWYAPAVRWAASQGIVSGYGNSAFGPNDPITREQLAAILSNYAAYKGYAVAARADLSAYTDQPSAWAESAMQWAVAEKLITGKGNGVLDPTGQATRAEIAAIVMRFVTTFAQ